MCLDANGGRERPRARPPAGTRAASPLGWRSSSSGVNEGACRSLPEPRGPTERPSLIAELGPPGATRFAPAGAPGRSRAPDPAGAGRRSSSGAVMYLWLRGRTTSGLPASDGSLEEEWGRRSSPWRRGLGRRGFERGMEASAPALKAPVRGRPPAGPKAHGKHRPAGDRRRSGHPRRCSRFSRPGRARSDQLLEFRGQPLRLPAERRGPISALVGGAAALRRRPSGGVVRDPGPTSRGTAGGRAGQRIHAAGRIVRRIAGRGFFGLGQRLRATNWDPGLPGVNQLGPTSETDVDARPHRRAEPGAIVGAPLGCSR